jgi:hypothetical protein
MEIIYDRDCCDARFLSTLADKENSAQQIYSSMVFWLATFHLGLENQRPMLQPGPLGGNPVLRSTREKRSSARQRVNSH